MRFLQPLIAAATMAAVIALAPSAHAQRGEAGTVIVIDYQRIIATSDVGRDMTTKLGQIRQQMAGELQPEAQAIQAEETSLNTAARGQTEAQIRANRALSDRIQALNQRAQVFQQRQQTVGRDYQYTEARTLQDFNTQITPIVREVMQARRAAAVLDAGSVQLYEANVNATDDVLSRLNQRLRTINVTRQSAPTQQQPAAPAPATPPRP